MQSFEFKLVSVPVGWGLDDARVMRILLETFGEELPNRDCKKPL